jgi:UDP-GlcNAc3NAcA epimerase
MYDSVKYYREKAKESSTIIEDLNLSKNDFILVTIHRAENTNDPARLRKIFRLLDEIAEYRNVVFPIHPRTKNILKETEPILLSNKLRFIDPVGYLDMIALQSDCRLVITDSGGVQKEAFLNGKYCLTVRNETEWVELVEHGFNFLINPLEKLPSFVDQTWAKPFNPAGFLPYGSGNAADIICDIILKQL